jgi:DNA polymerase III psi subunit
MTASSAMHQIRADETYIRQVWQSIGLHFCMELETVIAAT